jgi:hypothetical protein
MADIEFIQEPTNKALPLYKVRPRYSQLLVISWTRLFSNISGSESVSVELYEVSVVFLINADSCP